MSQPLPHIMLEIMQTRSEVHYDKQQVARPSLMSSEAPECTPVSFKVSIFQRLFHLFNLFGYLLIFLYVFLKKKLKLFICLHLLHQKDLTIN